MNDDLLCKKCGCLMSTDDGAEPTDYCNDCAHARVEELEEALQKIRDHQGFDENNCAMDLNELQQAMRDIAEDALDTEPKEEK